MHTAAFVQVIAALNRQLPPGGDRMALSSLTQLATGVAPKLIGLQAKLRDRRIVGSAAQRWAIASAAKEFDPID